MLTQRAICCVLLDIIVKQIKTHDYLFILCAGVIGDLINERADAAFNSRFITDYGTDEIDFLYPVFSDRYCVIAPAALPLPKWAVMLRCFRTSVWCILLMAQWCCVLVWFGLRSIRLNRRTSVSIFHRTVLEVCQVLLSQAIRLPAQLRERFFLGTFLITHVIILGIFEVGVWIFAFFLLTLLPNFVFNVNLTQGSLTLSFRSSITENEIDTLQQLYDSGLPIISSALSIKNLFGNEDERPLMRSLQAMHKTRENTKAIRLAAFDRTACSVERYSDVKILIKVPIYWICVFVNKACQTFLADPIRTSGWHCTGPCRVPMSSELPFGLHSQEGISIQGSLQSYIVELLRSRYGVLVDQSLSLVLPNWIIMS